MTKRLSPERLAEGTRLLSCTFNRTYDFTERVRKFTYELLNHIDALEAELKEANHVNYRDAAESFKRVAETHLIESQRLSRLIDCYDPHGPNPDIAPLLGAKEELEKELAESRAECERLHLELADFKVKAKQGL